MEDGEFANFSKFFLKIKRPDFKNKKGLTKSDPFFEY